MNKKDKERHLRRLKTKAMIEGRSCKHDKRKIHEPGYHICLDCGEIIKQLAHGSFTTPLNNDLSKKSYVLKLKPIENNYTP